MREIMSKKEAIERGAEWIEFNPYRWRSELIGFSILFCFVIVNTFLLKWYYANSIIALSLIMVEIINIMWAVPINSSSNTNKKEVKNGR